MVCCVANEALPHTMWLSLCLTVVGCLVVGVVEVDVVVEKKMVVTSVSFAKRRAKIDWLL
jgi:hypothetical protein